MELIEIINTLNNILQPHFYLVDEIYSDIRITNFEKLINANKQNELLEMVKQLNISLMVVLKKLKQLMEIKHN